MRSPDPVRECLRAARSRRLSVPLTAALLAVFARAAAVTAAESVPTFDPNATLHLDMEAGGDRPDEYHLLSAFEQQYDEIDECVAKAKSRRKSQAQLLGNVEMNVLLNPQGERPLGVNATMPPALETAVALRECLRRATAAAPYPGYDGPPVVASFYFEIDPGTEPVEQAHTTGGRTR